MEHFQIIVSTVVVITLLFAVKVLLNQLYLNKFLLVLRTSNEKNYKG